MSSTTRFVETPDGVKLFVHETGPEDGPPLLVLHGGPAAHHEYLLPGFAALATDRRVVFYDQRGGGRSRTERGADHHYERNVEDVGSVLDALGLDRVDLCGYSFGGLWALLFAARHPERVHRLVLVSAAPPWHGYRPGLDAAMKAAAEGAWVRRERDALERSGLKELVPEEYRRRRFALQVAGYTADPRLCYGVTPFRVQGNVAARIYETLGEWDFRGDLAAVDGSRTLLVHGENDPIDVSHARETAKLLGARLETLSHCGHVPYLEAPEPFLDILRGFLGDPS